MAMSEASDDTAARHEAALRLKAEGNEAFKEARYNKAAVLYTESLKLEPSHLVFGNRAQTYINLQQYELALRDLNTALALEPHLDNKTFTKNTSRRAKVLAHLGMYSEARADLATTLRHSPKDKTANTEAAALKGRENARYVTVRQWNSGEEFEEDEMISIPIEGLEDVLGPVTKQEDTVVRKEEEDTVAREEQEDTVVPREEAKDTVAEEEVKEAEPVDTPAPATTVAEDTVVEDTVVEEAKIDTVVEVTVEEEAKEDTVPEPAPVNRLAPVQSDFDSEDEDRPRYTDDETSASDQEERHTVAQPPPTATPAAAVEEVTVAEEKDEDTVAEERTQSPDCVTPNEKDLNLTPRDCVTPNEKDLEQMEKEEALATIPTVPADTVTEAVDPLPDTTVSLSSEAVRAENEQARDTVSDSLDEEGTVSEDENTKTQEDTVAAPETMEVDTVAEEMEKITVAEKKIMLADEKIMLAQEKITVAEEKITVAEQKIMLAEEKITVAEEKNMVASSPLPPPTSPAQSNSTRTYVSATEPERRTASESSWEHVKNESSLDASFDSSISDSPPVASTDGQSEGGYRTSPTTPNDTIDRDEEREEEKEKEVKIKKEVEEEEQAPIVAPISEAAVRAVVTVKEEEVTEDEDEEKTTVEEKEKEEETAVDAAVLTVTAMIAAVTTVKGKEEETTVPEDMQKDTVMKKQPEVTVVEKKKEKAPTVEAAVPKPVPEKAVTVPEVKKEVTIAKKEPEVTVPKKSKKVEEATMEVADEKPTVIPPAATSYFEFIMHYNTLKNKPREFGEYFLSIPPSSHLGIFSNLIQNDHVNSIVAGLAEAANREVADLSLISSCLHSVCFLPRFDLVVLFLNDADKEKASALIDILPKTEETARIRQAFE